MRLGNLVRRHRLARRLSQETLAEMCGLSSRSVGEIERGGDALNQLSTIDYTHNAAGLAQSLRMTNPAGHTEDIVFDTSFGRPLNVTDANGKVTTGAYDPLGRLVKVWHPGRPTTGTPNLEYVYSVTQTAVPSIATKVLSPSGSQITSYEIFDGLLRPRQNQSITEEGKRTIADTQYDERGLAVKSSMFYNDSGPPASTLMTFADSSVESQTRTVYDGAGRKTFDKLYKNDVFQWQTETRYGGDRVGVIPPAGGVPIQELIDVRGQVTEKRLYTGAPFTGAFQKTTYGYDKAGKLVSVKDSANNEWTYKYDLLGRKIETTDPDAGSSTSTYDDAGQLTSSTDGRGQALFYDYDSLGRMTKRRADNAGGTILAEWTYDTWHKGQLATSIRHIGSDQYKTRFPTRDDGYRPLRTEVEIPNATVNGALAATYGWDYTYKPNGAPATTVLPGVGGLPAETLTYGYDTNAGMLQTLTGSWSGGGSQTYLAGIDYTYDGLVKDRTFGQTGDRVKQLNTYDPATRRLTVANVQLENTPDTFTEKYAHDYAYDQAGNVTAAGGGTDGVRDHTECFRYDTLGRLSEAWTQTSGCGTPQRAGVDPYWRQWTFDGIGNRLTQTDKDTAGDTSWTYTVASAGSVKPHQLKTVTASGPKAGTPTRTFGYDLAGNTTSATTATGAAQTLTWDKEGHLATVTEAGVSNGTYVYDADGNRLITRTPSKNTLYLPDGTELELPNGGGAALGTRYYAGVAVRNPTGLKWICNNHQGTSLIQIDSVTLASSRRRTMPYGEDRTATPSNWMGTKGFVGGTKDVTGYTHLGAREYDPSLGRFISVDPVMDLTDPRQWHGYSYANNTPVTSSDPSGLIPACGNDMGPCSGLPTAPDEEANSAHQTRPSTPRPGAGSGGGASVVKPETKGQAFLRGLKEVTIDIPSGLKQYWESFLAFARQNAQAYVDGQINFIEYMSKGIWWCLSNCPGSIGSAIQAIKALWNDLKLVFSGSDSTEAWAAAGRMVGSFMIALATSGAGTAIRALRGMKDKPGGALPGMCPAGGFMSFTATTSVLMADGSKKPIGDIEVGDVVFATDPETGEEGPRVVEAVWFHEDDIVKLDVDGAVIETTEDHPFWNETDREWQRTDQLDNGDHLRDAVGGRAFVVGIVGRFDKKLSVYNLTVAGLHTYYVLAGSTPVLVHNCNGGVDAKGNPCNCAAPGPTNWNPNSRPTFGHTFSEHGAGPDNTRSLTDRARSTGNDQGQWTNNADAAEWLRSQYDPSAGARQVPLPAGMGNVIRPDGTVVPATHVQLVPGGNGPYRTAFPIVIGT